MFIKNSGTIFDALLVYVDDIVITSNDLKEVETLKSYLNQQFKLKDLGKLKYFLGIEVACNNTEISINQRNYASKLLKDAGCLGSKPMTTPMDANVKLTKEEGETLEDPSQYRRLIGRFL